MAQWVIEISELSIQYKPRLALKGQVLAYFLVELPQLDVDRGDAGWWILNVDYASYQTGAEVGLQLKAPTGEIIEQTIQLDISASNNETKYEAILVGIDLAKSVSSEKLIIRNDSQLVVGQVNGEYEMRDQCMVKYASLVKQQLGIFEALKLEQWMYPSR